jgi:hypothetical protein
MGSRGDVSARITGFGWLFFVPWGHVVVCLLESGALDGFRLSLGPWGHLVVCLLESRALDGFYSSLGPWGHVVVCQLESRALDGFHPSPGPWGHVVGCLLNQKYWMAFICHMDGGHIESSFVLMCHRSHSFTCPTDSSIHGAQDLPMRLITPSCAVVYEQPTHIARDLHVPLIRSCFVACVMFCGLACAPDSVMFCGLCHVLWTCMCPDSVMFCGLCHVLWTCMCP